MKAAQSNQPKSSGKGVKKRSISSEVFSSVVESKFVRFFALVAAAIMMVIFQPPQAHPILYILLVGSPFLYGGFYLKPLLFEFGVMRHIIEVSLGVFDWYNAVDDNLLLGAIPLEDKHAEELARMNISLVLSVVEPFELETPVLLGKVVTPDQWKKLGIEQRVLSCPDNFPPPMNILEEGAKILDSYLSEGKRVYVHCKSGKGRSASVVMAYFVKYRYTGMDLLGIHRKLYSRRTVIFSQNSRQMRQIEAFEKKIRSNKLF